ncbi:MAG: hypothetical protein JWO03_801 [Bacteroidetes bacterium]|nr:hypothetical protein [Bacteroidota bacterium]
MSSLSVNTCSSCGALTVGGDITVDANGENTGTEDFTLRFGECDFTGEVIGSKRSSGGNEYGLDFYTDHINRLAIMNNGNVGIGTTTPNTRVKVIDQNNNSIGVEVIIVGNPKNNLGITGVNSLALENIYYNSGGIFTGAGGNAVTNIGVGGQAFGAKTNYGVYGYVTGSQPDNCAGFFDGDVVSTSNYFGPSDEKLKSNIQDFKNALEKLKKIQIKTYDFKTEEYKDKMSLPSGNQIGVLAQNLQSVFPNLVKEKTVIAHLPADSNAKKRGDNISFLSVNYLGLVPVLVAAVKDMDGSQTDMKNQIEQLKKDNADLRNLVNDICSNGCTGLKSSGNVDDNSNKLYQNTPNPFSQQTTINYLFKIGNSAYININSLDGKIVKHIDVYAKGNKSISINANEFSSGTYTYSFYVDENIIDTKIMVITSQQ